jgi:hypothetical protein
MTKKVVDLYPQNKEAQKVIKGVQQAAEVMDMLFAEVQKLRKENERLHKRLQKLTGEQTNE